MSCVLLSKNLKEKISCKIKKNSETINNKAKTQCWKYYIFLLLQAVCLANHHRRNKSNNEA